MGEAQQVESTTVPYLGQPLGQSRIGAGRATVEGFRSTDFPEEVKRRVGLVSASAGLYPHLSVREMLLFFADLYAVPPELARSELARLAERMPLWAAILLRSPALSRNRCSRDPTFYFPSLCRAVLARAVPGFARLRGRARARA